MKVYDTKEIRNIALIGHGASGKTTFAEAALHTIGLTGRMGKIEDGNTKSDFLEDEIARQISIGNALLQGVWNEKKLNIIDTPGYADFVGEVICALRAVDVAVIFVDAVNGLEVGTETAWELCEKYDKPRFFVVNRAGKEHAKAEEVLAAIQGRFGIHAIPVQIMVNPGVGLDKIVDIVSMKQYSYALNGNGKGKITDIPDNLLSKAEEYHEKLIEAAAESDDTLMEKFFESGLTAEEIAGGIKRSIINKTLYPIVFTDAYTNVGIDLFMNLVADSAPSPADIPAIKAQKGSGTIDLVSSKDAPLSMLVFKTDRKSVV